MHGSPRLVTVATMRRARLSPSLGSRRRSMLSIRDCCRTSGASKKLQSGSLHASSCTHLRLCQLQLQLQLQAVFESFESCLDCTYDLACKLHNLRHSYSMTMMLS